MLIKNFYEMSNLIKCKDCGHQISINAESCPNCGSIIKKLIREADGSINLHNIFSSVPKIQLSRRSTLIIAIIVGCVALYFIAYSDLIRQIWDDQYAYCRRSWKAFVCKGY